ncbi:MAG: hypothetical protein ACRCYS_16520, partial [Beijerinckiaceae bacterium]
FGIGWVMVIWMHGWLENRPSGRPEAPTNTPAASCSTGEVSASTSPADSHASTPIDLRKTSNRD